MLEVSREQGENSAMPVLRFRSWLGALLVTASPALGVAAPPAAVGAPPVPPAAVPSSAPASASPAKPSVCTARLRGLAHLRPHPKGLDASCPLAWPGKQDSTPSEPMSAPSGRDGCYKGGVFARRRQLIASACWTKEAAKKFASTAEKLDGDFTGQTTVFSQDADEHFGLVFHNKQGWRAYLVELSASDRHEYAWQPMVHAGRATYLLLTDAADYDEEAGDTETYRLLRLLSDGRLFEVLRLPYFPDGSRKGLACKVRGNTDESVTLLCGGRSQTFTWDATVNRLVPKLP